MKLLFDQNLSFRLCQALADLFPASSQVRLLGLAEADDRAVRQHAKANGFVLVTQDSDFADMAALYGQPPKVIWLRCGNQPTQTIEKLLRDQDQAITAFEQAAKYLTACYEEGPEVFLQALRDVVEAQGGMTRAARLAGLNRESLYRQLSRRGNPSLASLNALLTALRLKLRFAAG